MAITIQSTQDREGGEGKVVFFTIAYKGKNYRWHGVVPEDVVAQDFLDAESDTLKVGILRKLYREAKIPPNPGDTENPQSDLDIFEAWVSAGCKNPAETRGVDFEGNDIVIKAEEVIAKATWVDTH